MWTHFTHLFFRILHGMPALVSSNWAAWIIAIAAFVFPQIPQLVAIKRSGMGWRETLRQRWKISRNGLLTTAAVYMFLFTWSTLQTVYDDHHDSTSRWQRVVMEKNDLKEAVRQRDDYIKTLERMKSPQYAQHMVAIAPEKPHEPTIKAFARGRGVDKDGFTVTEFTLTCDSVIPPPLVIEMEFDVPIYGLGAIPSPAPAAMTGGGERWNGTHGYATIPNAGINPNLTWIVIVKSRGPVNLIKPPHPRSGY